MSDTYSGVTSRVGESGIVYVEPTRGDEPGGHRSSSFTLNGVEWRHWYQPVEYNTNHGVKTAFRRQASRDGVKVSVADYVEAFCRVRQAVVDEVAAA